MKAFFKSRVVLYLLFMVIYYVMYKLFGFELTVIIMCSTIIGELTYLFYDK